MKPPTVTINGVVELQAAIESANKLWAAYDSLSDYDKAYYTELVNAIGRFKYI